MIDVPGVQAAMRGAALERWAQVLPQTYAGALAGAHGRLAEWRALLGRLPRVEATNVRLDRDTVSVGGCESVAAELRQGIAEQLELLHPWRKGPFSIHGVHVDSEWRSDWKWARIAPHLSSLRLAIGIDPTWIYVAQFLALRHFLGENHPVHLLPIGIEKVPPRLQGFDTVFSMGVLYHRRSPLDHLLELRGALKPRGELVLETLVVEGGPGTTLTPKGRYAKMRNVWFIPSVSTIELWLARCGFTAIRTVDVTRTTTAEQRATNWMTFESLVDFLDPHDSIRTIEGYPAPLRAFVLARRSGV
jgi:tRNA (mo5U34)-methyltransferase